MSYQFVKRFKVGDLFDVTLGKPIEKNLQKDDGLIPVVTAKTTDNGVDCYVNEVIEGQTYENLMTMTNRGQGGVTRYHFGKFVLGQNTILFEPKCWEEHYDQNVYLYLASVLNKLPYGDGYTNYPTKTSIVKDEIQLPVDINGEPDWNYMRKYITVGGGQFYRRIWNWLKKEYPFSKNL